MFVLIKTNIINNILGGTVKSERHQAILNLLERRHTVSVNDIAYELGVSTMTVRRDLADLSAEGLVTRIHGGAQLPHSAHGTTLSRIHSPDEKHHQNVQQKRAVAMLAAQHVHTGDSIFMGGGSILEMMCEYLPKRGIRVLTNSAPVFSLLADNAEVDLYLIGGTYRPKTRAFILPSSNSGFFGLTASKAFVSATGIFDNEVFGPHIDAATVLADALNRADERYIVTDDQKVGRRDYYAFTTLDRIDAVFTNPDATPEHLEALRFWTNVITG